MPKPNKNNNNGGDYLIGPPPFESAYQTPSLRTIQPSEEDIASLQRAALEAYGDHRFTHDQFPVKARQRLNNKTVQANQWLDKKVPGARRWINGVAEVVPGLTQLRTFIPDTTPYGRMKSVNPYEQAANLIWSALDVIPAGMIDRGASTLFRPLIRRIPQFLRKGSKVTTKTLQYTPKKEIKEQAVYWGLPMLLEGLNNNQEEGTDDNRGYYSDPGYRKYVDEYLRSRFE